MNNEAIKKIADTYGFSEQSRQLYEEMAELTQAINKAWRMGNDFDNLLVQKRNIKEEIADVYIMLEQMKYLLNIYEDDIETIINRKILRQLERIEKNE